MISRLFLLQIVLFVVAITTAKTNGDLKKQSNMDLIGPSSGEDSAKEQKDKSQELSEPRSEAPETGEVMEIMLSFAKVTDETSNSTTDSDVKLSTTQVFITTPKEDFTQASSTNIVRRDLSETASTILSTEFGSTEEKTLATTRPSTSTKKDEFLDATTSSANTVKRDIAENTSTMPSMDHGSTGEETIATVPPTMPTKKDEPLDITTSSANTVKRDIAENMSTMPSTDQGSTGEETIATVPPTMPTKKDELFNTTTKVSDLKTSTLEIITATMDITQRESTVTPRKDILGSTSAILSEPTSIPAEQSTTEKVGATMISPSASTGKDDLLEVTTAASEVTNSISQEVVTQSSEKSTSHSLTTLRRDVLEIATTMPSTSTVTPKKALTNEVTTATMLPSKSTETDQILHATTEALELKRSTSQVVLSSTEESTQADPIPTMRKGISEFSASTQTTAFATAKLTEDAASKASTSEGSSSTTTAKEVSPAATTMRTFLENDDPIANTSTAFLSTSTTSPSPVEASVSTISSTSTVTSPIIPTILPSTQTERSHSTSTSPSNTIIPESTSKVPSTTTSAKPTTAKPQTCVDATKIGNRRINCFMYRRMCYRKGYNNMLKKYCPVTCGYCKLCVDQIRNRRNICTQRTRNTLRMCNHRSSRIRANTRKRCPVTCGICSKGSVLLLR